MKVNFLIASALISLFSCSSQQEKEALIDLANPLQGTDSVFEFSTGNTYPAVAVPWGMNFWTPQTGLSGSGWQYVYSDTLIRGFKQTHQPSPWINDYGCFALMPVSGKLEVEQTRRASRFSHENEISKAYYYRVDLDSYDISAEMTASNSGAIFRFDYPQGEENYLILDGYTAGAQVKILPEERKIIGSTSGYGKDGKGTGLPENFATHFVIEFDCDFTAYGTHNGNVVKPDNLQAKGKKTGAYVKLKTQKGKPVTVRVASSFIGPEQAQLNFDREIAGKSFDQLKKESKQIWEDQFRRVHVKGGTSDQQKTFYTALYRTMLFPRATHEYDKNGEKVHFDMFNGVVKPGAMYTDNGFWDTFRAVHPFFNIMFPSVSEGVMQAMVSYYHEGGWIPEWFSPAYRNSMIGQNSTSVIAGTYLNGTRNFDVETAFEALVKGANAEGPNATGRAGFDYYNKLGYIPCNVDVKENVSRTLEYAYNDFCIYSLGKALGKPESEIGIYKQRAMNYKNVFDPSINFVRPKDDQGNWITPYRPDSWAGNFTEGSAWHWTWCVFHDPQGLINLMGGRDKFIEKLDSVFIARPTFYSFSKNKTTIDVAAAEVSKRTGMSLQEVMALIEGSSPTGVIHEITEMVAGRMGQYAHGNQPIQHMIYLYNYAGEPYKAQKWVRYTMDKLYSPMNLCGDEDNGQTSAWYVFSALGFYPVCPVSGQYVIGTPLFEEASLELENGRNFKVIAQGNSPENCYIQSARLNGKDFDKTYITHQQIMEGGTLEFVMGSEPNPNWGSSADSVPFSLSAESL